jgi:hypothetical protein
VVDICNACKGAVPWQLVDCTFVWMSLQVYHVSRESFLYLKVCLPTDVDCRRLPGLSITYIQSQCSMPTRACIQEFYIGELSPEDLDIVPCEERPSEDFMQQLREYTQFRLVGCGFAVWLSNLAWGFVGLNKKATQEAPLLLLLLHISCETAPPTSQHHTSIPNRSLP